MKTMQFCPYTGTPRHPDDIKSDPQGLLIIEDGQALNSACPDHSDGRHVFDEMGLCYGKTCKAKQQEVSKPGPMAATVEEAARDVSKCLNERAGQGLDLRHVAMLVHHAQMSTFTPDVKTPIEPSPTAGMNMAQRILHVGGRNNAAGYVEFGSVQAVQALARQFERDMAPAINSQGWQDGLVLALQRIADWNSHSTMLGVDHGSNGVRDFYRQIALEVLASAPPAPQAEDDSAASVNDTNAALAGRYFELLKVVEQYEKSGVTCQTFRHFISEPCAECNSPGICGNQASVLQQEPVAQCVPDELRKEAKNLASILAGMGEGSYDLETLYTECQADGDGFVRRAADLLEMLASAPPAPPAPQAKPQPLSDKQIIRDGLLTTPLAVLHNIGDTFKAGARFAEAAHGIKE